jgi:tRNA-binding EMAP/Myf-like protein
MDMRVGTIIEASKMPKANKLLILKVDTGIDVRTIVSGIAESFKPEDIVGKKVTVIMALEIFASRKSRNDFDDHQCRREMVLSTQILKQQMERL